MVLTMTKKLVAFPATPKPKRPRHRVEEHTHIIVSIGGERFALDIGGTLTELNPAAAPIFSIQDQQTKPEQKRPPHSSDKP
jgi:hypothetical protein